MIDPDYPSRPSVKTTGITSLTQAVAEYKSLAALKLTQAFASVCMLGQANIDEYPRNAQAIDLLQQLLRFIKDLLEQEDFDIYVSSQMERLFILRGQREPRHIFKLQTQPYLGSPYGLARAEKFQEKFFQIERLLLTLSELDCSFVYDNLKVSRQATNLLNTNRDGQQLILFLEFFV